MAVEYGAENTQGLLTTYSRFINPKKVEKMNFGSTTVSMGKAAYHWGGRTYPANSNKDIVEFKLQPGQLVKVFKTVTDGDIAWQGKIDLDTSKSHYGRQKNVSKAEWDELFGASLPVKLERDGQTIFGAINTKGE